MRKTIMALMLAGTIAPAGAEVPDFAGAIAGVIMAEELCGIEVSPAFMDALIDRGYQDRGQKLSAEVKTVVRMLMVELSDVSATYEFCLDMGEFFDER